MIISAFAQPIQGFVVQANTLSDGSSTFDVVRDGEIIYAAESEAQALALADGFTEVLGRVLSQIP